MFKNPIRECINRGEYRKALNKLLKVDIKEVEAIEDRWFLNYELGLVNKKLGNKEQAKLYCIESLRVIQEDGMYDLHRLEIYLSLWLDTELNKDTMNSKEIYRRYFRIYRLFSVFSDSNIYKIGIVSNIAIITKNYPLLCEQYDLACQIENFDLSGQIYKEMKKMRKEAI